jgi:hypothetical protein
VEAAIELARAALHRMGISGQEQAAIVLGLRRRAYGEPRDGSHDASEAAGGFVGPP